jgi:glycogen(starch) synthase
VVRYTALKPQGKETMSGKKTTAPCLFYAAGPGDVVKTFQAWQAGHDDDHQVAVTYSSQFFEVCRELGAKGVVVSSNPRVALLRIGQFHIENRPKGQPQTGVRYHLQQLRYVRGLMNTAVSEGADMVVAAESTGHLFTLPWFSPATLALVPTIHCTLWPKYRKLDLRQKILNFLSKPFLARRALATLVISEDVRRQLHLLGGDSLRPVYRFRPYYRRDTFAGIAPPSRGEKNFHILFAGRLEENKGVFDLLDICRRLKPEVQGRVIWHLAGDGSCDEQLRVAVKRLGLEERFIIHGYCHREKMMRLIGQSHAFIVPTTKAFEEGFNKVVAEAVLCSRPVITSAVCPAVDDVRAALVEVAPDDRQDYCRAVERLVEDIDFYQSRQAACQGLQQQFYDPANSWRMQLKTIVAAYCKQMTDGADR